MKQRISIYPFATLWITMCVLLASCVKADIHYPVDPTAYGVVEIYPDNSVHTLPALHYYFYNQDGITDYIKAKCDGMGNYSGLLDAGNYRVIALNASARNVVFGCIENYEIATVSATFADIRMDPRTGALSAQNVLTQPDSVYRVVVEDLTATGGDTLTFRPAPQLLTRRLILVFSLEGDLAENVTALWGGLPGVLPSVNLFTGETSPQEASRAPSLLVGYVAAPVEDSPNLWIASINLFGLHDPAFGGNYRNVMTVNLTIDGRTIDLDIDLTEQLSLILEHYNGTLPVGIPLELEVALTWEEYGAAGQVKPWEEPGGDTETPVPV